MPFKRAWISFDFKYFSTSVWTSDVLCMGLDSPYENSLLLISLMVRESISLEQVNSKANTAYLPVEIYVKQRLSNIDFVSSKCLVCIYSIIYAI